MSKDDKAKSEAEKVSDIKFIDALNDLIENVPLRKGTKKDSLLKLICSYYKTDDDLFKVTSIPLDNLIKTIYFSGEKAAPLTPKQIKNKRKNFSSLKSSLNKNFRAMAEEGTNPLGIIVGKSNAFNVSMKIELNHASESGVQNLASELSDILSNAGVELKGDMEEKLKEVVHNEFVSHQKGIEKIEEKRAAGKANKQLKKKLKEVREESSSLKEEIKELKESVSVKEQEAKDLSRKQEVDQEVIKNIEKKLTSTIAADIEKNVKALTEKDQELEEKEKILTGKENKILQLQQEKSEEEIALREKFKKEKEIMEKRFHEEKDIIQKNIDGLVGEQMALTKERDEILDDSLKTRDSFDEKTERLRKEKEEDEKASLKEWKELTGNMAALRTDEKGFLEERDYQQRLQLLGKKRVVISDKESRLKEDEVDIMAKAERIAEDYLKQLKPKEEELEKKESQLMGEMADLNQEREELKKMRQEFESSRNQVLEKYKDKIVLIDGVIHQKVRDHVDKLMEEIGIKKEDASEEAEPGLIKEKESQAAEEEAMEKASEMPSSGEGSVGDFGDEMELAAPPKFERMLTQDYSLSITVPPGEFFMGCDDIPESGPRHKVIIEQPFRISKYPVTTIQFLQFVKEAGYFTSVEKKRVCGVTVGGGDQVRRDHNNKVVEFIVRDPVIIDNEHASWKQPFGVKNIFEQKFNHPVTMITWWDCMAYCDWLSQKAGVKCRLPTEKEWEYVASNRGQLSPGEFYWGRKERVEKHCNSQNSFIGDTTPVDKFLQNKTVDGVRDMLGNVWEWTLDVYCSYSESSYSDNDKQEYKAVRGGSYALDKGKINTFIRRPYKKMYASSCIGFRVVSEE